MKTKKVSILVIIVVLLSLSSCNNVDNKNSDKNTFSNRSNIKSKEDELEVNNEENRQEETDATDKNKEDYLEACKLFSDKYIFLEEKIGKTRQEFLDERIKHAEMIDWNGKPVDDVINDLGEVNKKSSPNAQNEIATRFLTLENGYMPLREELKPVEIVYKKYDELYYTKIEWKDLKDTYSFIEHKDDEEKSVLFTSNYKLSLEDIPKNYRFINESLIYYFKEIDGIRFAVLHPRDLISWIDKELNKTMEEIISYNPDVLLVDLEDTAGGSEIQAIQLAEAININKKMI